MQASISIVSFLALLVSAQAVSAQGVTYSASVSFHSRLQEQGLPPLNDEEVKKILADASKMLQKNSTDGGAESGVPCDVTFALRGSVRTFDPVGSREEDNFAIVDEINSDAVHRVSSGDGADFSIKVVRDIRFCRKELAHIKNFAGCSFSPPDFRSMVVIHPTLHRGPKIELKGPDHLLWTHEFGHMTGLAHRDDEPHALMTHCSLARQFLNVSDARVQVSQNECRNLRGGPGFQKPGPSLKLDSAKCLLRPK